FLDGLEGLEVERARALAGLLAEARAAMDAGAGAEDLLWTLWTGTSWPERLRRSVEAGGGAARRAHRDLDSICALFDVAVRAGEHREHLRVAPFLESLVQQEIPADTLADKGARGAAVRLLTAHRSKGLEWRLVVVAHVQDGGWPDLRRRTTLLQADRIGHDGVVPAVTPRELLAEERRLFYVACTRARERLVVTAVKSPDDEGEQPSRFLEEVVPDLDQIRHVVGRPERPLSMTGLVAELRRTAADPTVSSTLREAAARRLARLAGETVRKRPLVPAADPANWWGTRSASRSVRPIRDADQPVPVSASILESIGACPARWFLEREAGGVARTHQSANLGQIVHALAERVAQQSAPADPDALMAEVDRVWDRLDFRTPWSKQREYARVRAAIERFLSWHAANPRRLLATEARFSTVVAMDDGEQVKINGYADRVELDGDGRVVVVDLKTGRGGMTGPQVRAHLQLALYQYAVDAGALDRPDDGLVALRSGGAELVQLGLEDGSPTAAVQPQDAHADDCEERAALRAHIAHAARLLREEQFPAVSGEHCRQCGFMPLCPAKSPGSVVEQ
ncbi:ATP-dependent helicase, partial [Nocardioides sp.]